MTPKFIGHQGNTKIKTTSRFYKTFCRTAETKQVRTSKWGIRRGVAEIWGPGVGGGPPAQEPLCKHLQLSSSPLGPMPSRNMSTLSPKNICHSSIRGPKRKAAPMPTGHRGVSSRVFTDGTLRT